MSRIKCLIFIINFCIFLTAYADDKKPCEGQYGFLDLVNRPSIANSPCTVPNKEWVLEGGYRYKKLADMGEAQVAPFGNLRLGLPANTEIFAISPNYTRETIFPKSGFGPTSVGLKHVLFSKGKGMVTAYGFVTPPSGGNGFGTRRWGGYVSSILNYELTEKIGLVGEFSFTTTVEPPVNGGQRFSSFNPDFFISYNPVDYIEIFAELYGETKTGYQQGSGFIGHIGFIYLIKKNWTIDLEAGQRIYGLVLDVERFVGVGTSIKF
jgi:hypothetical protein